MRIRKNARLLELMLSSSEYPAEAILQTTRPHVCHLNQSPWDLPPFSSASTSSSFPSPPPSNTTTSPSYPTKNQLEGGEYSLSGNASLGNSIGATVESVVASMKVEMAAVKEDNAAPELESLMTLNINKDSSAEMMKNEIDKELEEVTMCSKTNGKTWKCKRYAMKGHSWCDHHTKKNNNYSSNSSDRKLEKLPLSIPPQSSKVVRRRGRGPGKKASTANPYEFYYYSGFGPRWGKRRGERNEKNNAENMKEQHDSPSSSLQQIEHNNNNINEVEEEAQVVQFMEDEDADEDEDDSRGGGDDNGRKRVRKPVKARSLKSFM